MPHTHRWPGVPLALLSAALFGASTPLASCCWAALTRGCWRACSISAPAWGSEVVRAVQRRLRQAPAEAPLRRGDLPWLGAVVIAGGVLGPLLLLYGLARTDAASGSLLLNLEGLATLAHCLGSVP